jgi:hypothetical protein
LIGDTAQLAKGVPVGAAKPPVVKRPAVLVVSVVSLRIKDLSDNAEYVMVWQTLGVIGT